MGVDPLTVSVIALVTPYLRAGAEEFAKEAGKEACAAAKTLFGLIKSHMEKKAAEAYVVNQFEADPDKNKDIFAGTLSERISGDEKLAEGLKLILSQLKTESQLSSVSNWNYTENIGRDKNDTNITADGDVYYHSTVTRHGKTVS